MLGIFRLLERINNIASDLVDSLVLALSSLAFILCLISLTLLLDILRLLE